MRDGHDSKFYMALLAINVDDPYMDPNGVSYKHVDKHVRAQPLGHMTCALLPW